MKYANDKSLGAFLGNALPKKQMRIVGGNGGTGSDVGSGGSNGNGNEGGQTGGGPPPTPIT